jgi:hypothetical protein
MGSAKGKHGLREKFGKYGFYREEWPFPVKGIWINHRIYIDIPSYLHYNQSWIQPDRHTNIYSG